MSQLQELWAGDRWIVGFVLISLGFGSVIGCASPAPDRDDSAAIAAISIPVTSPVASDALTAGWVDFMEGLVEARRSIEDPSLFPPAADDRNLAEGYRYMLGHLARIIEAETQQHPDFPYFQRSVRMLSKWTIDNPDTMYLGAAIDAEGVYRIRGRAPDTTEWRSSERGRDGLRAPRVVIFQTTTNTIGDTGDLAEMSSCRNQTIDSIDQFQIHPDSEGRFEILVAAERPDDYHGLFLSSRKELACPSRDGTSTTRMREAKRINVREIFSVWEGERALDLEIVREDMRGAARPPRTSAEMAAHLSAVGEKLANQIKFWNALHEIGLELRGDRNGDGRLAFPRNGLNPPAPPFIAGGTAGAGQFYSAGTFELPEDEALVVRVRTPVEPHYVGFQLGNLWGESLDQANYVSSQTGGQNPVASDGARYYVVSALDPGVPGWLDTTGLSKVTMSMRFIFENEPRPEDWPVTETFVTKIENVQDLLPDDTPQVSAEARRIEVDQRQRHIQRRWRQY